MFYICIIQLADKGLQIFVFKNTLIVYAIKISFKYITII